MFFPKTSSQSLNLTGGFLFLLFKPLPGKFFVVHLEVVTSVGLVVRISFSNLFKQFKSTSTWLQFPFKSDAGLAREEEGGGGGGVNDEGLGRKSSRWTFLSLNLKETLSKYLFSNYSYLKNIKLCASVLVKGVFTSDIEYSPLAGGDTGNSQYFRQLPREMLLPVGKGEEFLDMYDYICFPYEGQKLTILKKHREQLKGAKSAAGGEVVMMTCPQGEGTKYVGHHVTSRSGGDGRLRKRESGHATKVLYNVIRDMDAGAGRTAGDGGVGGGHVTSGGNVLANHMIQGAEEEQEGVVATRTRRDPGVDKSCDIADKSRDRADKLRGELEGAGMEREGSVHVYAQEGTEVTIHRGNDPLLDRKITLPPQGTYPTVSWPFSFSLDVLQPILYRVCSLTLSSSCTEP